MSTASTVDAEHVAEVCRLAALAAPHATLHGAQALSHHADESGVTVVLVSHRTRRTAERALRRHGYRLEDVPPDALSADIAVRVTAWSPTALKHRISVLSSAVSSLERSLPVTIAQAARAYALLHDRLDPAVALYGTADTLRADAEARITRRTGPLPRRRPAPRDIPDSVRRPLAITHDLTQRLIALLAQHWHAAVRTAERYGELSHRHTPTTAQTMAVAEMSTTIRRQRRTELFLDACGWADQHLGADHIAGFAQWYVAEFGPPAWNFVPFDTAARRWNTDGRPAGRRRTTHTASGGNR